MKKSVILLLIFVSIKLFPQGPGLATNPNPLDSATAVFWFDKNISWINPSTASAVKVNVGIHPDFLTELYSGPLITNFILPSPLDYRKTYYWRIDEVNNTGITVGNTWLFTTQISLYPVFIDSFNLGMSNWNTINLIDSCDWEWKNFSESNYNLPPTSKTYGVVFDKTNCINNRSINVLELNNPPSLVGYTRCGIGWDNDLMLGGNQDTAYVEVSKDGGLSWNKIWERFGRSQRKSQEEIFLGFLWNWDIRVRFYSSFQSSINWWAIDNFYINATSLAFFQQIPPSNLQYNLNVGDSLNVQIFWDAGVGPPSVDRYRIQRKFGDSLNQFAYFTIAETDLSTLSFIDDQIDDNTNYTYKVSLCEGPIQGIESYPITVFSVPVPVELTSFTSSIYENDVTLNWKTATETNNQGFEVQRKPGFSQQSSIGNGEWDVLGFVNGNGTTTEPQTYSFVDENISEGKYQYRLKQIDFDGTFEYSNTIEVEIGSPNKFSLEQNYPNPFNPSTSIKYALSSKQFVSLKVFDVLGKEIATLVSEEKTAGSYEVEFESSEGSLQLASGIYFYQLKAGDFVGTKKMILLK